MILDQSVYLVIKFSYTFLYTLEVWQSLNFHHGHFNNFSLGLGQAIFQIGILR